MPNTDGDLGTILGIWAHPDDEVYGTGGLMVTAVRAGRRVVCVTATRGEAGFPVDDPRSLQERKAVRTRELDDCLAVLGVSEHSYLDYPDGGCMALADDEPVAALAALIAEIKPDTILTFGPDGGTGHPDHITLCRWTTLAVEQLAGPRPTLLYSTKSASWADRFTAGVDRSTIIMAEGLDIAVTPDDDLAVAYRCDDDIAQVKLAALRAQVSQVEGFVQRVGVELYTEMFRDEFFRLPEPGDREALDRNRNLVFRT